MNESLKPLAELSPEQLTFLKQQVGTFASKLGLQITRDQARLDGKLDKRDQNKEREAELETVLAQKRAVLEALEAAENIDQAIVENQVQEVEKTQKELERIQTGPNTLTDVEAYLEQYEIELQKLEKAFYEERVAEVDAVIAG